MVALSPRRCDPALMGILIALAFGLLAVAAPAEASAIPLPPKYAIQQGECPAYSDGGSCADIPTATVWLAPGATRFTKFHELAHLFDVQVLTDADRAWFTWALEQGGPWFQGTGMGTRGPSELFADAYASCALNRNRAARRRHGLMIAESSTTYGYQPTRERHRLICRAIEATAARSDTAA